MKLRAITRLLLALLEGGSIANAGWYVWHESYEKAILMIAFGIYFSLEGWGMKLTERGGE